MDPGLHLSSETIYFLLGSGSMFLFKGSYNLWDYIWHTQILGLARFNFQNPGPLDLNMGPGINC
jgi:hypothetical protein